MSSDTEIGKLLLRWQEARRQGQFLSDEQLCRDFPGHRDQVERRICALAAVDQSTDTTRKRRRDNYNSRGATPMTWQPGPRRESTGPS
jgi:hypothetical protein